MGDFFSGLIGAGANLLNGMFNRQQQNSTNAANRAESEMFAMNQKSWAALDAVNAEKLTGINRLAMLGVPPGSGPSTSVFNADDSIGKAGQDIGRAANALTDKPTKMDQLNEDLLRAKIANTNADTAKSQAEASSIARKFAAAGQPPPLYTQYRAPDGSLVTLPTKDASSSMQNWASMPNQIGVAVRGVGSEIRDTGNRIVDPVKEQINQGWQYIRPDVERAVNSLGIPGGL